MVAEPRYPEHFAQVAQRYDALREGAADEVIAWLNEAGRFKRGQSLVDVGCGTGATTARLANEWELHAVGVDPSPEMLATAAQTGCERCRFVHGHAEALPLADDSFNRALMQTAVHLMRRPEAFKEARRVLRRSGLLTIFTVDPDGVDDFWLAEWFASYPAIDRQRFPDSPTLRCDLEEAGFEQIEEHRRERLLQFTRDRALTMLRARFASSFALIPDQEFEAGLSRAERDMPETFTSVLRLIVLVAGSATAFA